MAQLELREWVTQALPQSHQLARKYCHFKLGITLELILSA
jgi:hypothetical protein